MRVLMLFLDGVGIGRRDPAVNPFFVARIPAFRSLFGGEPPTLGRRVRRGPVSTIIPLDATLGVPGLPQSGTGQATLFTGVNAPAHIGLHFGPYPHSQLRPILEQQNLFQEILQLGKRPWFANAYPQRFFDHVNRRPTRMGVTSFAWKKSGLRLLGSADLARGEAVSGDVTNAAWKALGEPGIAAIEPAEAGRRLAQLVSVHDFVLFEYWKTDEAGHARSMTDAVTALETLDRLLEGVLESLDRSSNTLLFLTSDHGNIEDLSVKTHTRNPVPALFFGERHADAASLLQGSPGRRPSLIHVAPTLLKLLARPPE